MDKFVVKVKRHLSSCETDQGKKPRKVFIDRCQNSRPTCPQSKEQPQASGATGSDDVSPNPLSMYNRGLQTTARGPNPAREAISSGPRRNFANKEKQSNKGKFVDLAETFPETITLCKMPGPRTVE